MNLGNCGSSQRQCTVYPRSWRDFCATCDHFRSSFKHEDERMIVIFFKTWFLVCVCE